MSLYAIGDLHLHFSVELKSEMMKHGALWKDHERIFRENCRKRIRKEDTLVLLGDHSLAKNLAQAEQDLAYIEALPGTKILLRGNHDAFWDAKKTEKLNELYKGRLHFLQNNFYAYRDYALVGTKGFCFEGPFYLNRSGRITGWDEEKARHAEKLVEREAIRLRASFEAAKAAGYSRFILFLHYPPTNILQTDSVFTELAKEYGVCQVLYAHSHGKERFHDSLQGPVSYRAGRGLKREKRTIRYSLVSGDFLYWNPLLVLP